MRLINLEQLRSKLGGRSRNAIFTDIENELLPSPIKLGSAPSAKNYWDEKQVDIALSTRLSLSNPSWKLESFTSPVIQNNGGDHEQE